MATLPVLRTTRPRSGSLLVLDHWAKRLSHGESVLSGDSPHVVPDVGWPSARQRLSMTILWFIVWLIANSVGGHEPLVFNPVNAWTATLILAIGLDLAAAHARGTQKGR
jgi:hypothetical protein